MALLLRKLTALLQSDAPANSGERRCPECSGVNGDHTDSCSKNHKNW